MACRGYARNAGVDDLGECGGTLVGHEVEDDSLDVSTAHISPFEVVGGEFSELGSLFGHGLNGSSAIVGFLRAGDIG